MTIIKDFNRVLHNPLNVTNCINPSENLGIFGYITGEDFDACGSDPNVYICKNIENDYLIHYEDGYYDPQIGYINAYIHLYINSYISDCVEAEIESFNNTGILIEMPEFDQCSNHILSVRNGCGEEDYMDFIVYLRETGGGTDENGNCITKPTISLNFDTDGANGKYGAIQTVNVNPDMEYIQVFLKYNLDFDWETGGEVELDGKQLFEGDKVWLSNQSYSFEEGIYIVRQGTWDFYRVVNSDIFVDLGATASDSIDGDLTRNIVTHGEQLIDFSEVGFYSIHYYVVNSNCVLSRTMRKVKIIEQDASIVPINTFKITHYEISSDFDSDLIK